MSNQSNPGNKKPDQLSGNARIRARRQQQREEQAASGGTGARTSGSAGGRTIERRREREEEKRRQRLITTGIIVGAVVLVAAFILLITQTPADAPVPAEALTRYEGVSQSRDEDGFPRLGDPAARVEVAEFSNFSCVACKNFHDSVINALVERVRAGSISFTYVPLADTLQIPNAQGAAVAAVCAAEQGQFWQFHDMLFHWQSLFGNTSYTNNRILSGVGTLGLDRGRYDDCVRSGRALPVLDRANQRRNALVNFVGTPTITINGVVPTDENQQPLADPQAILAAIDEAIAAVGSVPPAAEATAEPGIEATAEATAEAAIEATDEPVSEATPENVAPVEEATEEATAEAG